ncbi:hypothetical protein [Cellulomonas cellasea]|uniref:Uncharacterized protein n=1 Tax=Cellulomonas cellasea TaxID=43670 RepID=A0A7W4YAY9_9CELL|nr:hypothetical protein [Cellulomonas cellasea]MBB2922237.1 hypothetical protein [Cellulomonas cellasea]
MQRSRKIASSALLTLALTTGAIGATSPAHAVEGNRVYVEAGSEARARALCLDKQSQYSSMRVRITKSCHLWGVDYPADRYYYAFYWTAS